MESGSARTLSQVSPRELRGAASLSLRSAAHRAGAPGLRGACGPRTQGARHALAPQRSPRLRGRAPAGLRGAGGAGGAGGRRGALRCPVLLSPRPDPAPSPAGLRLRAEETMGTVSFYHLGSALSNQVPERQRLALARVLPARRRQHHRSPDGGVPAPGGPPGCRMAEGRPPPDTAAAVVIDVSATSGILTDGGRPRAH